MYVLCTKYSVLNITFDHKGAPCFRAPMARAVVRIPLDVEPDLATAIDRAVGYLQIETETRQTRTSFIKMAIQAEVQRLDAFYGSTAKRPAKPAKD